MTTIDGSAKQLVHRLMTLRLAAFAERHDQRQRRDADQAAERHERGAEPVAGEQRPL